MITKIEEIQYPIINSFFSVFFAAYCLVSHLQDFFGMKTFTFYQHFKTFVVRFFGLRWIQSGKGF